MEILSDGLYKYQWEWIQREAAAKQPTMDGAQLKRQAIQWYIDAVESGRNAVIATPEQDKDFDELIRKASVKTKPKSKKQNKLRSK